MHYASLSDIVNVPWYLCLKNDLSLEISCHGHITFSKTIVVYLKVIVPIIFLYKAISFRPALVQSTEVDIVSILMVWRIFIHFLFMVLFEKLEKKWYHYI